MKLKKQLSIVLWLIVSTNGFSQYCWNTINTVTTDWRKPNTSNTWDWTQELATMYLNIPQTFNSTTSGTNPLQVTLPMWSQQSSVITNNNLDYYQSQPPALKDHRPEDGWELLVKNFGESYPRNSATNTPFFALYNRFTGKIRAFFCLVQTGQTYSKNGAYIGLKFTDNTRRTAAMQHLIPIAFPVKLFDNTASFKVPNNYVNQDFYWMYADFPMAYDPCTCTDPSDSKMTLEFSLIDETNITATIDGLIQTTTNVISNGQPGSADKNTGLPGKSAGGLTEYDPIKAGIKGYETYKTWNGYKETANKVLDGLDNFSKNYVNGQLTKQYGATVKLSNGTSVPASIDGLKASEEGVKILDGLNYDPKALGAIKGVASAIPYVGAIWGVVEYFVTSFTAKPATNTPAQTPVAHQTQLKLNGTLKNESMANYVSFYTPGSKATGYNGIPTYNNILGVINMIDSPSFEYVDYRPIQLNSGYQGAPNDTGGFTGHIRQYRLSKDLKYVLNPAANLTVQTIDATLILQYDSDNVIFPNRELLRDVDKMPAEFGVWSDSLTQTSLMQRLTNQGYEMEYISPNYFTATGSNKGIFRVRTPYVPIECFRNSILSIVDHSKNENPNLTTNSICCRNKTPRVLIKLAFTLSRNDDPNAESILYIMTFDVTSSFKNAQKVNNGQDLKFDMLTDNIGNSSLLHTKIVGFTQSPAFPTLINTPAEVIIPSGTVVNGDIRANKKITVKDNVTLASGIKLWAGEEIVIEGTNSYNSQNEFNIQKFIGSCTGNAASYKETDANILSICQNTIYKNRFYAKTDEESSIKSTATDNTWSSLIYPNPTSDRIFFTLKGQIEDNSKVVLINSLGSVVYEGSYYNKSIEASYIDLTTLNLSSGMYFVTIFNGDKSQTHRVSIISNR